jgi:FkbM family methyltransferase
VPSLGTDAVPFPRTLLASLAAALAAAGLRGALVMQPGSALAAAWAAAVDGTTASRDGPPVTAWPHVRALIGSAPLEELLPHCAVAMHHGGAGTVAAAAAAGVPQLIVPFMFDQSDWAERCWHAGVSPPALRPADVCADPRGGGLASAAAVIESGLRAAMSPTRAAAARALQASMAGEDGVAQAVSLCLAACASQAGNVSTAAAQAAALLAQSFSPAPAPAPSPQLVELPGGLRIDGGGSCSREVMHIYREVFVRDCYLGAHGFGAALPRGALVVDVGAHVGLFALRCAALFSQRCDEGAHIICLEPVPVTHAALRANTRALPCVSALRVGCGAACGGLRAFSVWPALLGQSTLVRQDKLAQAGHLIPAPLWVGEYAVMATMMSLDELLERRVPPGRRVSLLKVDVEGAELQVLHSAGPSAWARIDAAVVEVHTAVQGRLEEARAVLRGGGLTTMWCDAASGGNPDDTLLLYARRPRVARATES